MEPKPLGKSSQILRKLGKMGESEERLAVTLRSIGDAVIATGTQGEVTLMNPVAERLTGWSEAEAAGKPLDEVFHIVNEETRQLVENPVDRVLREGAVVGLANHTLLICKDEREIPIADSGTPIRDAQGEISGVVLVFRDQSAERAAQNALRQSEERFRSLFDQASVSIWEKDFSELKQALDDLQAQGVTDFRAYFDAHPEFVEQAVGMIKVLDINDETVRMFEAESKEDLLGSLHKTFTPESLTTFRDELVAIAGGQTRFEQPATVQTLRGKPLHILLRWTTLEGSPSLHRVLVSMMDISGWVQAENELRRREQQLSLIYDSIGDILYYLKVEPGPRYRFLTVNSAFLKATGLAKEQIVGKTTNEIIPEPSLQLVHSNYEKAIREKRIVYWEETSPYPAGLKTGIVSIAPVFDEKGDCTHLVGSVHDITARVQAEQALARREEELRVMFYSIGDAVIATDIQGQVTLVNPVAEGLTGWNEAEALGRPLAEVFCILNEETGQPVENPVARVLREGLVVGLANHTLLIARDGTERPIADSGAPIRNAQGEISGVVLVFRDQTEEREAQRVLRRLATVLTDSNDAVTVQDLDGNIKVWNRGAERMYGWSAEEAYALNIQNIIPENKQEEALVFVEGIRNGNVVESFETQRKTKDGRNLDVWLTVSVLTDTLGNHTEIAVTARDITERKRAEAELRNLNEELEQRVAQRTRKLEAANKEMEAFAYSVSHDLKAPVRAIIGFSEIIARRHRQSLNAEGQRYFDHILTAGHNMSRLIEDLLQYARLGRKAVRLRPLPLADLLSELEDTFEERFQAAGGRLDIAGKFPTVRSDPTLLSQIFTNLVDNALSYHRPHVPPRVEIGWRSERERVIVAVQDNGIGIPAPYHTKIFEIFQRLHSQEEKPGTGIGLALVKKAVTLIDGHVWLESTVGEGTTFYVDLPISDRE